MSERPSWQDELTLRAARLEQENAALRAELAECRESQSVARLNDSSLEHRLLEAIAIAANTLLKISNFDKAVSTAQNLPDRTSQPWSNPPTPINRYRPVGRAYQAHAVQPTSAIQPVKSQPSFRNKSRKRGVVLTQAGWQKLMQAGVLYDAFGKRYTHEELSERSLLDARTVSRAISCEVKVDKRTLTAFFRAFDLKLEPDDYTTPSAK